MNEPFWRQLCLWELAKYRATFNEETGKEEKEEAVSQALFDESFCELLGLLQKLHDGPDSLMLPAINGSDEGVVHATLVKLHGAVDNETKPPGLDRFIIENELGNRLVRQKEKQQEKKKKKNLTCSECQRWSWWTPHPPAPLQLKHSNDTSWRSPKTTAALVTIGASNSSENMDANNDEAPKPAATAPIIKYRSDSVTSQGENVAADEGENKKKTGGAYRPQSVVRPPRAPRGTHGGRHKKADTWGGNKRRARRGRCAASWYPGTLYGIYAPHKPSTNNCFHSKYY